MEQEPEGDKVTKFEMVIKSFGFLFPLVYICIGILILTGKLFPNILPKYVLPAGSIMIVYGLFRAYGVYQKIVNNN